MHELLTELISEPSSFGQNDVDTPKDEPDSESTSLVNSTSDNAINPVDTHKLMSTPGKGKDTSNKKQIVFSNEFTKKGKPYRECSHNFIYYATKSSHSSTHSLVDRGDNGGVAGRDVRLIGTHSNHKVDILDIGNHEITAIPLVTTGGVTSIIKGEVIVIMHHHVCHSKNRTIHSSPQIEH